MRCTNNRDVFRSLPSAKGKFPFVWVFVQRGLKLGWFEWKLVHRRKWWNQISFFQRKLCKGIMKPHWNGKCMLSSGGASSKSRQKAKVILRHIHAQQSPIILPCTCVLKHHHKVFKDLWCPWFNLVVVRKLDCRMTHQCSANLLTFSLSGFNFGPKQVDCY